MKWRDVRLCTSVIAATGLLTACSSGGGGGTTEPTVGAVSGTVTSNGSGVAGVQVSLTGKPAVTTNANGSYSFTAVPTGTHTVGITIPSGQALAAGESNDKTVTVSAGQTSTVDWSLQPAGPTTATVDTVRLSGTSFSPSTLTVKVGSTIVWVNTESMVHTITPDGHSRWARAETNAPGEVVRATIANAGTYAYFCEPHRSAGMTGRIIVEQ